MTIIKDKLLILSKISRMEAPRRLEHEPAHLSRLCQERNQLQASCQPAVLRRYQSSRAQSNTRCFCTSQGRRLRGTNNGFSWFNLSSSWTHTTHSPDCPLSRYTQQRNDVLELKYTYCTRLLGFSVAAILSTTRRGGLPELTSNLIFRAIVSPDSPAFRLVRSGYLYPLDRTEKMATTLDHAGCILRRELETLFRTGKAHPKDVLPNGKTLLHVSARDDQLMI